MAELQEIGRARPHILTVELEQAELDLITLIVRFRLRDSGEPGELRLASWNDDVESPSAEADFSVGGVSHVYVRHTDGADERDRASLSPAIREELGSGAPALMLVFWAVLSDPRVYSELAGGLITLHADPSGKNPLCGTTKWGLKALVWAAEAACCGAGGFSAACVACVVGGNTAVDAINDGIDCNKECKPDCPIA
ncbi:hypothetical protein [Nannocystis radixulma]|uniref:Uncharacterized protein n=1 Tax=Nannocystis radixulma TaxID=2995305 RepID=A0ABT5B247_9BACT|nr:hypothetical protein [Nannocystis radixulma]MDC0668180.1 hypothetical protein [Nannocystis radixulma]